MDKKTLKIIKEAKENPIFEGLPDKLKDPKNFIETEQKIVNTMVSDHRHKTIKQFIKCKRCQAKVKKKAEMIRDLGFKSFEQYQNWKRIMGIMINKQNLKLYEKKR
jgi:hypothetical protein